MTTSVAHILQQERRWVPGSPSGDDGLDALRGRALGSSSGPANHFEYGAFVLGPVLSLFAEWVVAECAALGQPVAHCLMREGHLFAPLIERAAAAAKVPLEVHKLWASRFAVRAASYREGNEAELRHYFFKRVSVPSSTAARELQIDESRLRQLSGIAHGNPLQPAEVDCLVQRISTDDALRTQMIEGARENRRRLFDYFESKGVFAHDRLLLVDLGWGGTTQTLLSRTFRDLPRPKQIHALYVATHEGLKQLPGEGCSASSFLFHLAEPADTFNILRRTLEILEQSCMPSDGSFRGIGPNGEIENFPQVLPAAQLQQIAEMQRGITHFAEVWFARENPSRDGDVLQRQRAQLRAILARALQSPTLEEARLFQHWAHDSNDGSTDVEPLFGAERVQRSARFMSYDQIMRLDWYECFWPQGLARLVGRTERDSVELWRRALHYPAVRNSARAVSTTLARVLTRPAR